MTPEKLCLKCKKPLVRKPTEGPYLWNRRKFCNHSCAKKGERYALGVKRSDNFKKKVSLSMKKRYANGHKPPTMFGADNPSWKGGLLFRKREDRRGDSAYGEWRRQVWLRDNFKCKMSNLDCDGRLEAHHILRWNDFPELRYELNNGITLCHHHHPRNKRDEKILSPYLELLLTN